MLSAPLSYVECHRRDADSILSRIENATKVHLAGQTSEQELKSAKEKSVRDARLLYSERWSHEIVLAEEARVRRASEPVA